MTKESQSLTDADYARLADFRYAMRCFLEFSEIAAIKEGLTPQQHQALLVIRGSEGATATVGRLAERLRIRHHTAVEQAQRLEAASMISRETNPKDRRSVLLRLTSEGDAMLERLSLAHRAELGELSPQIMALLESLTRPPA
jgi:DNA-binding MarR family transcriptional regulator